MPEWFMSALAAAAMGGLVQSLVGMRMIGKMEAGLTRVELDVKDMQRDKLDKDLHDLSREQLKAEIRNLDDKHTEHKKNIEHKVNGVGQRVTLLEQRPR